MELLPFPTGRRDFPGESCRIRRRTSKAPRLFTVTESWCDHIHIREIMFLRRGSHSINLKAIIVGVNEVNFRGRALCPGRGGKKNKEKSGQKDARPWKTSSQKGKMNFVNETGQENVESDFQFSFPFFAWSPVRGNLFPLKQRERS